MINLNRRSFIRIAGAAATLPIIGSKAFAAEPLKIGYIYVGPINDGGWNTAHEKGRQAMLKELGDKVTSVYVENVPEGPDAERVLRRVKGVAMTRFTSVDVVRHPLVARIVEAYEAASKSDGA